MKKENIQTRNRKQSMKRGSGGSHHGSRDKDVDDYAVYYRKASASASASNQNNNNAK
jgi:hypothetical protein